MSKMNPEVKAKWVAALESGEFQQGQGQLRTMAGEFCCLGVLCEMYRRETGSGEWDESKFITENERGKGTPPEVVGKWAGFEGDYVNPEVFIDGLQQSVAEFNDGGGGHSPKTFAEIAAAIREQL